MALSRRYVYWRQDGTMGAAPLVQTAVTSCANVSKTST